MKRNMIWVLVAAAALALAGCRGGTKAMPVAETPPSAGDSVQVFVFAETPVLIINSDLMADRFMGMRGPEVSPVIDSSRAGMAVYEILLDTLLGKDADTFNLAVNAPDLYRQYEQLRLDMVMRKMFAGLIVDSVIIPDSAVRAYYEEHVNDYKTPDQYRARHIVVSGSGLKYTTDSSLYKGMTDAQLDSIALARITDLHTRLVAGAPFDTLAMMYSQDPNSAPKGGDLGYFQLAEMVPPFDSTVQHTPMGTLSGIIKTQYGWHVVRVEDFSPEHTTPLDSVYTPVQNKLKEEGVQQRSRRYIDSLRQAAVIVLDTAALEMADSLHKKQDPMAYVNPADKEFGNDTVTYADYAENVYNYKKFKKIEGELGFADKMEIINGVSLRQLLLGESKRHGYYHHPEVEEWSRQTLKKYGISTLRKRLLEDEYEPSDEELRAYYDEHIADYKMERPLTVQHIIFQDSSLAEHVRDLLMSGADFMEAARQYYPGDPDIRMAAADLGEIGPGDMPPAFWTAAMSTAVGSISTPVKTDYGYHLIKVLKKSYSIDFEQAKPVIKPKVAARHKDKVRREFVESRLGAPPIIHWERVRDLYFKKIPPPDFSRMMKP
jgi:parvulin-like peptidyl-prolyl isomerase